MSTKLKISCDEATTICDKNQYGEATFFDKIKLQIHLLMCKACSKYSKHNTFLTKVYEKNILEGKQPTQCMSVKDKKQIKTALEEISTKEH